MPGLFSMESNEKETENILMNCFYQLGRTSVVGTHLSEALKFMIREKEFRFLLQF